MSSKPINLSKCQIKAIPLKSSLLNPAGFVDSRLRTRNQDFFQ